MATRRWPSRRRRWSRRRYSRPYIAHAALGPSCALAEYRGGVLSVWSHTQGVYPLRAALANVLGLPAGRIIVRHAHGAGCYGHNGADDAAVDAAVIALQLPDQCIRVLWRREEEFGYEPLGTAMQVIARAALDAAGRPVEWTTEIWSGTHVQRPSTGGNLLTHEALPTPPPDPKPTDPPEAAGGGGTRNARPLYDFPVRRILHHLVLAPPVRTSALRGLGALPNVFAIECFMDELAERAGVDPVAYRLSLLSDPRARHIIADVAARSDWAHRGPAGTGRGLGIGWARYKNRAAYAAVAVAVEVEREVRLKRVWCTADAGLVINPDGGKNQLEGGIIQAASMTLKEQVTLAGEGVTSVDWRQLSDPEIQRGAGDRDGAGRGGGPADPGDGRVHHGADRGGDRQRGGACAGGADPRHAVHAGTDCAGYCWGSRGHAFCQTKRSRGPVPMRPGPDAARRPRAGGAEGVAGADMTQVVGEP